MSSMATEFHLFPLLPGEIRDMIWDRAVRSPEPGVHVFTIYGSKWETLRMDNKHRIPGCEQMPTPLLAAPEARRCLRERGADEEERDKLATRPIWSLS